MTYHQRSAARRWPGRIVAAIAGAAIAATVTALIFHRADTTARHPPSPAITVTATPTAPAPPAPLPTAEADRRTCNAWHAAGDRIHAASAALKALPEGSTIVDPQVQANPEWSAAVRKAADFYSQAGRILTAGIAPGTTMILNEGATAAGVALQTLSTAEKTLDAANGNAYAVTHNSADLLDVLCERLAPR